MFDEFNYIHELAVGILVLKQINNFIDRVFMKIAITGARGYVGRHVAKQLSNVYQVIGLAKAENNVTRALPVVEWRFGDLNDTPYLLKSTKDADMVIHCAMAYDEQGKEDSRLDASIIDALLSTNKQVIYTSSLFGTTDGSLLNESSPTGQAYWRFEQEKRIVKAGGNVIRLGFVYGGLGGYFWQIVKPDDNGLLYVTGDKAYTWPMIHVFDLANLYHLVVEANDNKVYHAWDGEPTRYFELFELIAGYTKSKIIHANKGYAAKFMQAPINVEHGNVFKLGWHASQGNVFTNLPYLIADEIT